MRRAIFWMHLATGLLVSALVLFFSVTGVLIAYERQIVNTVDSHFVKREVAQPGTARLPLANLVAKLTAQNNRKSVDAITMHPEENAPVEMQTAQREVYFVNPYSGRINAPPSAELRGFFFDVTALHRWFGLSNEHHRAAIAVKGALMLLFFFVLLTGPILWLPKRWSRTAVRSGMVPRFDVDGRPRHYNWHKVVGFWIGLPLALMVVTGVIMAYPWANALVFRLAGSAPPPSRGPQRPGGRPGDRAGAPLPANLDEAFRRATADSPDWQSVTLRLPAGDKDLAFSVDRSEGGHPQKREQVFVSPKTLQVVRRESFTAGSRGQQWRAWVRFVHTGEAGGWWGETIAAFSALGAVVLSMTGILLSLDRWKRWRRTGAADRLRDTVAAD